MKKINEWTITDKTTPDGATVFETTRKYGYVERRKMLGCDLMTLCRNKEWYTHGNNAEYESLIERVDSTENITTDDMVEIAADIIEHSNMSVEEFESVCYELFEICHTFMVEI